MKPLLTTPQLHITLMRLAHELAERHGGFEDAVLIGIQPRGVPFSNRIARLLGEITGRPIPYGKLDITFYRDDLHGQGRGLHQPSDTAMPFSVEGKTVVLADDVLYTGRTIRAAMDALLDFGRPARVELMALIDRQYSREVPIQASYVGQSIDSSRAQKVVVRWAEQDGEDEVRLQG